MAGHSAPVLLASSYYMSYDPKQRAKMKPYPPLATLISAAVLREAEIDVALFDAMLASGVEDFYKSLDRHAPQIVAIVEDNFNFLTKMCTTRMRDAAYDMIRAAKANGCHVIINSADATDRPEWYLESGADVVIVNEPDQALTEVVRHLTRKTDRGLQDVSGLVYRSDAVQNGATYGHEVRTVKRPYIDHLDTLPFPAWDLVDVERYRKTWTDAHGRLSWNVVTSRGCPYRCNWCAKPIFGTRYAQRSPVSVAEELQELLMSVRPDHIWFADDIFGLTPEWIEDFSREVAARRARIPFMMQSRVNLMKPRVVEALANAGAEEVWLGVESGSQNILDAMDKGAKIDQVRLATANLKQAGIRVGWFIQLGYPGEGWTEIKQTRDLLREERPDDVGVSVSYPLPGTGFYEIVKAELGAKQNWDHSDDLAILFRGRYSTAFYRAVRTLLHDEVRDGVTRDTDSRWKDLAREAVQQPSDPRVGTMPPVDA